MIGMKTMNVTNARVSGCQSACVECRIDGVPVDVSPKGDGVEAREVHTMQLVTLDAAVLAELAPLLDQARALRAEWSRAGERLPHELRACDREGIARSRGMIAY